MKRSLFIKYYSLIEKSVDTNSDFELLPLTIIQHLLVAYVSAKPVLNSLSSFFLNEPAKSHTVFAKHIIKLRPSAKGRNRVN
jgi:hypothetical protein